MTKITRAEAGGIALAAFFLALCCAFSARSEVLIDADIPAGNIICERVRDGEAFLRQELRGTSRWWFYWAFRVRGAEGRSFAFHFTDGEPVGTRGPAVSTDKGASWRWLDTNFTKKSFEYVFSPSETEVWFAFGMVYTQHDWERFIKRFDESRFLERGQLAVTHKGRTVEKVRVGRIQAEPRHRVLLTARHHACEMMANYALEGVVEGILADTETGKWLRENVEFLIIPFMDKDGVEDGDQGKSRAPRDHNRDYSGTSVHLETAALRELVPGWSKGKLAVFLDLHCPYIRGEGNEWVYQVGLEEPALLAEQQAFGKILEKIEPNVLGYTQKNDLAFGTSWNNAANYSQGTSSARWAAGLDGVRLASCLELPYATASGREVNARTARQLGLNLASSIRIYLAQSVSTNKASRK